MGRSPEKKKKIPILPSRNAPGASNREVQKRHRCYLIRLWRLLFFRPSKQKGAWTDATWLCPCFDPAGNVLTCLAGFRLIWYCKNNAFWKAAHLLLVFTMIYEHAFHICLQLQWFLNTRFIFACIYNGSGTGVSAFVCIYNEFEAWNQRNQYFVCIYNGLVAF